MYGNEAKVAQPAAQTAQTRGFTTAARQRAEEPPSASENVALAQKGKKTLEIRAVEKAWVRVTADSNPAEELMMSPGDVQIFTARKGFSLQIGNAGGIRLKFDGRELQELGKRNQTLSLSLP